MELTRDRISVSVRLGLFQVYTFPRVEPCRVSSQERISVVHQTTPPWGSWTPVLVLPHSETAKIPDCLLGLLAATFCSVSHPLSTGGLQISKSLEKHSCCVSLCLSSFPNCGPSSPGCLSHPDFFCVPSSVRMLMVVNRHCLLVSQLLALCFLGIRKCLEGRRYRTWVPFSLESWSLKFFLTWYIILYHIIILYTILCYFILYLISLLQTGEA